MGPGSKQPVVQVPLPFPWEYLIVSSSLGCVAVGSSPGGKRANDGSTADQFMACV